ncbi:LuxR C-terminal-related transcriptional regulator [Kitasatospora cineracea]|uniref:Regulatory LuxR family protein n=1 Tax=Kitasatospora cineracea TaxID=88074 RepID=A0A3N4RJW1_9ACTN|nr:LuxR C-terminal-related transcriptional regulator [Kitasatospora cineracea]ROR43316.1 regulatory LuxR family protein [Kitasatospora cineracea]RPE33688.1 regulatory LuxR family protein [Kitasatospora cineracea]
MSEANAAALPSESERRLYQQILDQGGRVSFREAVEQDPTGVLRLMELGLLVHDAAEQSLTAVDPRAVSDRISAELRAEGTRMLLRAEEMPALLEDLTHAYDATPRRADRSSVVQHVDRTEQIRHRVLQLASEAREEELSLHPGGAGPADLLEESLERTRRFLERGASIRTVYEPTALLDGPTVRWAERVTGWGGRFRTLSEPFSRMLVFDRRIAVVPASADNSSAAFVEDPAVVSFLVAAFERDWERADRVQWRSAEHEGESVVPVHEQVGRLLAQGLTQKAIASRLGLGERTVAAHISRLRELHDAETLFQLGWQMRGTD